MMLVSSTSEVIAKPAISEGTGRPSWRSDRGVLAAAGVVERCEAELTPGAELIRDGSRCGGGA